MSHSPLGLLCAAAILQSAAAASAPAAAPGANLALVASTTTSFVSGHEKLGAINDGATPRDSGDKSHGVYGNWPQRGTQWVQYEWPQEISAKSCDVYWFSDGGG